MILKIKILRKIKKIELLLLKVYVLKNKIIKLIFKIQITDIYFFSLKSDFSSKVVHKLYFFRKLINFT